MSWQARELARTVETLDHIADLASLIVDDQRPFLTTADRAAITVRAVTVSKSRAAEARREQPEAVA